MLATVNYRSNAVFFMQRVALLPTPSLPTPTNVCDAAFGARPLIPPPVTPTPHPHVFPLDRPSHLADSLVPRVPTVGEGQRVVLAAGASAGSGGGRPRRRARRSPRGVVRKRHVYLAVPRHPRASQVCVYVFLCCVWFAGFAFVGTFSVLQGCLVPRVAATVVW